MKLPRGIANLEVDDALHHGLDLAELILAPHDVLAGHLLDELVVEVFVFCLFGDLGPAERALFAD